MGKGLGGGEVGELGLDSPGLGYGKLETAGRMEINCECPWLAEVLFLKKDPASLNQSFSQSQNQGCSLQ